MNTAATDRAYSAKSDLIGIFVPDGLYQIRRESGRGLVSFFVQAPERHLIRPSMINEVVGGHFSSRFHQDDLGTRLGKLFAQYTAGGSGTDNAHVKNRLLGTCHDSLGKISFNANCRRRGWRCSSFKNRSSE
jgi:hypothetical protein